MDPPYRQPAPRTPEPPAPPQAVATHDAEPERDEPSTMWAADSEARERERKRQARLTKQKLGAAGLVVAITVLFVTLWSVVR